MRPRSLGTLRRAATSGRGAPTWRFRGLRGFARTGCLWRRSPSSRCWATSALRVSLLARLELASWRLLLRPICRAGSGCGSAAVNDAATLGICRIPGIRSTCGTRGTRRTGGTCGTRPAHPRRHGLLLTSSPTTRMSLGLLPPLPRQVVGRQAAGRRVVIGVDFILSAHTWLLCSRNAMKTSVIECRLRRLSPQSAASDPEPQHRADTTKLLQQSGVFDDPHARARLLCPRHELVR